MKIKHLHICNFTSLIDVTIRDLPDLVVFIGKNSSGKSNILDTLALLFQEFSATTNKTLTIQEHLVANHDVHINPPPTIAVTLTLTDDEWYELAPISPLPSTPLDVIEVYIEMRLTFERDMMSWKSYEIHFGDLRLVSEGVLNTPANITSITEPGNGDRTEIPTEDMLTILDDLVRSNFEVMYTTESSRTWTDRFSERPTIFDPTHVEELQTLSQSIGSQRQNWLRVTRKYEGLAPNDQRPATVASSIQMEEGILSVPIGMTGDGSQALLRLIDQLERAPQILAIEEPETHLHPSLIKKVARLLEDVSRRGKQVFIATHSPFLLERSSLECVFVVQRGRHGTEVSPIGDLQGLKNILHDIGMRPSDVLFSDAILLVEGLSDEIFLDGLSSLVKASLAERHVKIVRAGGYPRGKRKIEFWAEVGRDAGLPLYVVLDNDARAEADKAIADQLISPENCLVLESGALEDSYPWAVLQRVLAAYNIDVQSEIESGNRVKELGKLLARRAGQGNAWKPMLAEAMLGEISREDAELEIASVVNFLRKIYVDLSGD